MKLVLCGKGGSGKSTVAALLAKSLAENGSPVLVVDTDESNFGLHRQLGLDLPQDFTGYYGGKQAVMQRIMEAAPDYGSVSFFEEAWGLADLPASYISEKDGVILVAIGKIHEAGEGCACPMGMLARQFIGNLTLNPGETVIIDTEAGIEHFGRGIEENADAVLMLIDPSFESLRLSEKVLEMARSMDKPVYFILNKVDETSEPLMRENIKEGDRIAAVIPTDADLMGAGLRGEEIATDLSEIRLLGRRLIEDLG
ncbi:adenylyl-sulfate kinase [Methanofollis aquaemaris]|uniref:Adenylyl-sulfate kinase n=1 Tax=Methanofollis aquaemaris TaxID=126734 RepID=A0A8A3S3M0_9EURY|nr:P-loop NTPase [Methanofollis aquaemaris]QSZ66236.1 adenylyl-sulfate kinase [Methanofollis aquaemaris]